MLNSTRRSFLGGITIAAVPTGAATAYALAPVSPDRQITPGERLEAAVVELQAAMTLIHGEGVQLIRNGDRCIAVMEPHKPRIVEFAGPGFYEVEHGKAAPIYYVERDPKFDSVKEGRCFKLTPRDAKHLGVHYNFEHHLRTVLIKKL